MAKIKEQKTFAYWLFADKLSKNGDVFEINDYEEAHTTKKGKIVPVISLLGATGDGKAGDFFLSTWNVLNLNELLKSWGTDSSAWIGKMVRVTPVGNKVKMDLK